MDTMAGLARCALKTGKLVEAEEYADQVCEYLSQQGSQGMEFPVWAYVICVDVFEQAVDDERRLESIDNGYRVLMERAEKISDPNWRKTYLEEVPEHNELIAIWQKLSNDFK
jgi:hypothetical protein